MRSMSYKQMLMVKQAEAKVLWFNKQKQNGSGITSRMKKMVILAERSKITCRATHGPLLRCVTLSPHSSTTPLTKIVTELIPS